MWGLKAMANREQERVYGPDLMQKAFVDNVGWKHYLYGSTPETLTQLQAKLAEMAPEAEVVGAFSPPFRDMTAEESDAAMEAIRSSGADVVWVGLGMPKQELWMHQMRPELPGIALLGVGAAFDFLAGTRNRLRLGCRRAGLEWLFRLIQEPRRLWRRYIWNNPAYAVSAIAPGDQAQADAESRGLVRQPESRRSRNSTEVCFAGRFAAGETLSRRDRIRSTADHDRSLFSQHQPKSPV